MSNNKNISSESQAQAATIAKGTQKPGQSKEHTKLITAGIEKGIAQYKKQHKAKMRDQDKLRKKKDKQQTAQSVDATLEQPVSKSSAPLPWLLLIVSWLSFIAYSVIDL